MRPLPSVRSQARSRGGRRTYPHQRPFRPLHDRLPYTAIPDRQPLVWPDGARLAVWVVPNIEHYEYLPPMGVTDPYPRTPHPDVRKYAYHDFGNRVGFWRLLEVLDRYEIPCTVSLNVAVLDHYPAVAEAMMARGWAFMSHGLYNTRFLDGMTVEDERAFLEACNEALRRHTGHDFDGMLGPFITGNHWTPDLMAEVGMRYHADWVHDEQPAPLTTTGPGPLVALPYSYDLNDAPLLMRSAIEGDGYARRCIAHADQLLEEDATGRLMCLPLHPFAIGQPHRIAALDQVLAHLRARDDVWIATASQIVDHYLDMRHDSDLALAALGGHA